MSQPLPSVSFRNILGPGVLAVACVLCLLPFVALCWYAHPSADDFLTANDVRRHGHLGYVPFMYQTWTGRYTSALLWGVLHPVAYGNIKEGYGLVCLLLLLAVPVAFYAVVRALLPKQFSRRTLWLSSGVLTALFLLQMPSPAEGFYWITGGVFNYVLPSLLTLLLLAALARHTSAETPSAQRKWLGVAALLAVLVIGGNETNAIPLALGVTGFTALRCLQRRRLVWPYIGLTAVVAVACAVAFLAPGNFVRMAGHHQTPLWESFDKGALSAYRSVVNWLGNGIVPALTALLLPVSSRLWRVPALPLNRLAQNPLFITLLMAVSLVMVMFMGWWGTSQPMPLRSRNVLYLFFLIGWFLNVHAWARYLWRRTGRPAFSLPAWARAGLLTWIVLAFALGPRFSWRGHESTDNLNNVLVAYQDWLGGAAARYDEQLTARYRTLQEAGWLPDEAVVEPLQDPPRTILFGDITPDIHDWSNLAYADFFGKKTIRTR